MRSAVSNTSSKNFVHTGQGEQHVMIYPFSITSGFQNVLDLTESIKSRVADKRLKEQTAELFDVIITLQTHVLSLQAACLELLMSNHTVEKTTQD